MISKRRIQSSLAALFVATIFSTAPLFAQEQGNDSPVGVSGIFTAITTAGLYDPNVGNMQRQIDDIVVPGSVGAYPLKWTRYWNSHTNIHDRIGIGGYWRFSYIDYHVDNATRTISMPDGRTLNHTFGNEEFVDASGLHLPDGGVVTIGIVSPPGNGQIVDPYGQVTTIVTTGSGSSATTKITEPGGRYLLVSSNADGMVSQVQAFDGVSSQPIQWVRYHWVQGTLSGEFPQPHNVIDQATYSDGTVANYTYADGKYIGPCAPYGYPRTHWHAPLLVTADDPRYRGPMRQIAYTYNTDVTNQTRIASENHAVNVNGQLTISSTEPAVSTIAGVSTGVNGIGTTTATETRGDGATRTLHYHSVSYCPDCPPPAPEPPDCIPPAPLDGKLLDFTDFLGHTTTLTYETNDTKKSAGFITAVTDPNGHTTQYTRSSLSWGILRVTHPDSSHIDQTFTDEAHPYYLASRTDENGHTTIYHRDDPANPNAITAKDYADGSFETFTYNHFGQVLTHRMRNGAYQHFGYDGRGLLLAKTNPTWTADHNTSLGSDPQTTYTYYGAGDFNGVWTDRAKTETDPRGLVTQYEYDHTFDSNGNETTTPAGSRGLVTKIIHVSDNGTYQSFGYDRYGHKLWEENELRKRTRYAYDDYGRVVKVTNPLSNFSTNDFTPSNNTTLSPYVHTTNSIYQTTTPTGIITRNIYDENFRKISSTVGAGTSDAATTWFQYDLVGNPTGVTDPRGSGSGDPTYTTTTDYDQRNRKWHLTDPMGHVTTYGYDSASNITSITRSDQSVETKTYNAVNHVLTDTVPKDGTPANVTEYVTTTFDYYPSSQAQMAGELWHVTDGKNQTTTFEYDPSGLKTKMTYPNNADYQSWTYDNDNNLIGRRTVNGVSQLFNYDSRNREISMTWSNGLDWASFGYDAAGRMTSAQNPTSIVTRNYDDAGHLTLDRQQLQIMPIRAVSRKTHGSAGTFDVSLPLTGTPGIECRPGQGTNADQHQIIVTFPRSVNFNSAAVTSGTGSVSSTSQSADRTQVTINLGGVANAQSIIVTLSGVNDGSVTNDVVVGMGVLLGDTTGNGAVNASDIADVQGQAGQSVTSSNFREDLTLNGVINSSDIAIAQGQSGTGVSSLPNLSQPIPSSPSIDAQYGYDADGKNTRLYATSSGAGTGGYDLTFGYNDGQGRFKTISQTNGAQWFQYAYDAASNETHRTNNVSGLDQVYGRDSLNRMTSRSVNASSGAISVEVYGYDPSRPGLMTSVTHQEQGQSAATHDAFGYDLLPELNSAQYNLQGAASTQAAQILSAFPIAGGTLSGFNPPTPPNRNVNYAWDRAGNRTSLTDSAGPSYNYHTTSLNQYWTDGISNIGNGSEHELASYQAVNYTYINDSHIWTVSGTDIFGQQSKYEMYYDALGRRVVTVLNGSTTYYIYDGEKSILEYRGWSGGPSAADVYGKSIDEILKRTDYTVTPARTVYYQDDHEGSVTHLTDGSGNVLEYYRYDAFGKPSIYSSSTSQQLNASAFGNRLMFTGREYVATFGIYEYRNRAYHPGLGRFMSEDPKGFAAGDYNLFRYCHNDPEDLTDPMGLEGNPPPEGPNLIGFEREMAQDRALASAGSERGSALEYAALNVQRINVRDAQKDMAGFTMGAQSVTVAGLNMTTGGDVHSYGNSTPKASDAERAAPDAPKSVVIDHIDRFKGHSDAYLRVKTNAGDPMSGTVYSREHVTVDNELTSRSLRVTNKGSDDRFIAGANGLIKDYIGPWGKLNPAAHGDIYKNQTYDIGFKGKYYPVGPNLQQHQVIRNGISFPNDLAPY